MNDNGLRGHTTLRTRPAGSQPMTVKPVRHCERCGAVLAKYTRGVICNPCSDKERQELVDAELAALPVLTATDLRTEEPVIPQPRRRVMEVGGVKLVPATLPGRQGTNTWSAVVAAFLESGEECCAVETKGKPNSIQTALRNAMKDERRCYATARQGRVYLVRVKRAEGR